MPKDYAKFNRPVKRKKFSLKSILLVAILVFILGGILYTFSRGFSILNVENSPHSLLPTNKEKKAQKKPRFEFYTMLSKETVPVTSESTETIKNKANPVAHKTISTQSITTQNNQDLKLEALKPGIAPTGVPNIPVEHAGIHIKPRVSTRIIAQEVSSPQVSPKKTPVVVANPSPTKAIPSSQPGYITVAVVNSLKATDSLKAQLSMVGLDTHVAGVRGPNGNMLYRVSIGPFKTEAEILRAQKLLQSSGVR